MSLILVSVTCICPFVQKLRIKFIPFLRNLVLKQIQKHIYINKKQNEQEQTFKYSFTRNFEDKKLHDQLFWSVQPALPWPAGLVMAGQFYKVQRLHERRINRTFHIWSIWNICKAQLIILVLFDFKNTSYKD